MSIEIMQSRVERLRVQNLCDVLMGMTLSGQTPEVMTPLPLSGRLPAARGQDRPEMALSDARAPNGLRRLFFVQGPD